MSYTEYTATQEEPTNFPNKLCYQIMKMVKCELSNLHNALLQINPELVFKKGGKLIEITPLDFSNVLSLVGSESTLVK